MDGARCDLLLPVLLLTSDSEFGTFHELHGVLDAACLSSFMRLMRLQVDMEIRRPGHRYGWQCADSLRDLAPFKGALPMLVRYIPLHVHHVQEKRFGRIAALWVSRSVAAAAPDVQDTRMDNPCLSWACGASEEQVLDLLIAGNGDSIRWVHE
jgi:hypothetical protein